MSAPLLALTPGDPAGIGPEITWKAIQSGIESRLGVRLLCVGAAEPFEKMGVPVRRIHEHDLTLAKGSTARGTTKSKRRREVTLLAAPEESPARYSRTFSLPGYQSGWAIKKSVELVRAGVAQALVTGPISKERFQAGGFDYPGHTEFLAYLCRQPRRRAPRVVMMLANEKLRVALVTTHLSVKGVPAALSRHLIEETCQITIRHLRRWWKIPNPKVALMALNPHAGEGGIFGDEEARLITPVVGRLQSRARGRYQVSGPHPADTYFAKHLRAPKDDAAICMYHDQGLIPVKLMDFGRTVNITLGLPIIRTSVDHGVGFDIAGKGIADPSSLIAAVELAARLSGLPA